MNIHERTHPVALVPIPQLAVEEVDRFRTMITLQTRKNLTNVGV